MSHSPKMLRFDVETSRVIRILASEIYDSPHALLRENVQNAYDAILMRAVAQGTPASNYGVAIDIKDNVLTVQDDGIGMDDVVLRDNFWKAGSSGKRGDLAKKAGVVGTFGIGAMANFGVCMSLRVETRHIDSKTTLVSTAHRDTLKIGEPCIAIEEVSDNRPPGTKLVAELDSASTFSPADVQKYLAAYVQFLPVAVRSNGALISQRRLWDSLVARQAVFNCIASRTIGEPSSYSLKLEVFVNAQSQVALRMTDIQYAGDSVNGEIVLRQGGGTTMAYRNYFGLAPLPLSSNFDLGGFVNMSILTPTAGREALSRESIQIVARLVELAEREMCQDLALTEHADRNGYFQNYVVRNYSAKLAGNIRLLILPSRTEVCLQGVAAFEPSKQKQSYAGTDAAVIARFASEEANLALIAHSEPRRRIQTRFLRDIGVTEVPDKVLFTEIPATQLDIATAMVVLRLQSVLVQDYLLSSARVSIATISHGVSVHVTRSADRVLILISKSMPALKLIVGSYQTTRDIFDAIAKDFAREHIYSHVREFIPSSTRDGRDALVARLRQNRELYRIDESDLGEVESLLKDFLSGSKDLGDVLKATASRVGGQRVSVASGQVGSVEEVISDLAGGGPEVADGSLPLPPILREDALTDMKLLTIKMDHARLNNHHVFLALSEAMMKVEGDFFRFPHTTRVIWGGHRVIFIFTEPTGGLSLYYDIQLLEQLEAMDTGGRMVPTTTIITNRRIFIPVPPEIEKAFLVQQGYKEFFVRFDTIP